MLPSRDSPDGVPILVTSVTKMGASVTKRGTARPDRVAEALFGRTKRNVLGLLFGRPGEAFYLRQIVRATGAGTGAAQRELRQLVAADIVRREKRGQSVYFSANPESPVYDDLRSLLAKTTGIADVLRSAFEKLPDRRKIVVAFLHGSVAEGRHTSGSDIDLVVVGALPLSRLVPALKKIETRLGREINPTIYRPEEFVERARAGGHFLRRVLERPRIMLVGTRDDLEELAGGPLADHARVEPRGNRADLLAVVDRDLRDAAVDGLSPDWQTAIAYNAALQLATLALAAEGYRPERQRAHERAIQSLRFTIGESARAVDTLDGIRRKRNRGNYERAGAASDGEAREVLRLAIDLRKRVVRWMKERHPDLMSK